ncbi:hypothetical protein QZN08_27155 [Burkholderia multivorans]|uniref:hypothetical protein n=1 Tax=Burkholderia multivorans TaxID=87883 RepID=UPI001C23B2DF|nr:hypothetical protein [Burkholderia multivorans]MBU9434135.1 hypothetical protein [Burkholderia multivorans]MDN8018113.1 hypothetical protein [Burkholderia multivorans]
MSKIKFSDIKTREDLLSRVEDGTLSCGNQYSKIKHLLSYEPKPGMQRITVLFSLQGEGTKRIYRYI